MPIIVREGAAARPLPPEGLYPAVCVDVIERTSEKTPWGIEDRVEIRWQVHTGQTPAPIVRRSVRATLTAGSVLRELLEGWRGKPLTPDELRGFDLERLVGVQAQVQIAHAVNRMGRTVARVVAVRPPSPKVQKVVATGYTRQASASPQVSLDEGGDDADAVAF